MTDAMNHERAFELLPWLANGTLEGDERDRVERHIRNCLTCRAELREQRTLYALVREHPTVHLSAERSFAQWGRRKWGDSSSARNGKDRPHSRRIPRFAAAAVVAAVGAIAVIVVIGAFGGIGGAAWLGSLSGDADYRSLSTDARSETVHLDIIFADGTTGEQMRAVLAEMGGTIVDGPSTLGRYTVRLESSGLGKSDVGALVRGLLADERVRFAGQTFIAHDAE